MRDLREDVGACVFDGDTALALFDDDFPLAGGEQDGDTGAAGSGAVGASVVNVMTSILEVTLQVYTDKDRRVTVRDVAFLEHALHHGMSSFSFIRFSFTPPAATSIYLQTLF